jgi:hypothetical protein
MSLEPRAQSSKNLLQLAVIDVLRFVVGRGVERERGANFVIPVGVLERLNNDPLDRADQLTRVLA